MSGCPQTLKEKQKMKNVPYTSAVGSLMYAMMCTRPDICFAVSMVSRYQSNPGLTHWKAVKRILRYLKGTSHYSLCYEGNDLQMRGILMLIGEEIWMKENPHLAFFFLLNKGAISWSSKKQSCIALSTWKLDMWNFQLLYKKLCGLIVFK
ncbi:secreted RxLR effector protein 161-like [Rutidosis leptorrhynchoides]|uniref:secreted RxLR effector protein 161-like n=1 Tax=Rutidosis leptorrhynchoides TaxID=125765 RepID=UPI003A995B5A